MHATMNASQKTPSRRRFLQSLALGTAAASLAPRFVLAAEQAASGDAKLYQATVDKGIEFLRTKGQAADGSYTRQAGLGVTAIATAALLRLGRSPDDPLVKKSLDYLAGFVQPTGGIHTPKGDFKNYETCLAVVCFSEANKNGKYDTILKNADKFLKGLQFDGQEGQSPEDVAFGGAGYGGKGRPDLSNTAFLIDALHSTGNGADDQAIQNALIFVSRCQNLESPHNTTQFAAKVNDGGFYYTPIVGDDSKEIEATGGLRSYGTMTYAGLKSMIFAGVKADDPRAKAAVGWIAKNYSVKANPGMGDSGLFYYYHTFAKSLDTLGQQTITDAAGKQHNWRHDLLAELASRQREDGSWVNTNARWMEGDANLCTSFALLALSYCQPK
jgi:squalene-hopene/tetraprenyl-beta-curcumene cyclase